MNRLTLMQTQSQVPIRYFNSSITLEASNSGAYAAADTNSCNSSFPPSCALPVSVTALAANASSNADSADKLALKSSSDSVVRNLACSEGHADHFSAGTAIPPIVAKDHECLMLVTIKADSVADLRHLVMRTCGELIVFIRTQPIAHATRMKVWLCLSTSATDMVMDAVMRSLPSAEFGQITHG